MKYLILTGDYIGLRKGPNCYEQEKKWINAQTVCLYLCWVVTKTAKWKYFKCQWCAGCIRIFARVVNFDVCFRINLVLQVAKSVCRMWRVVVLLSTKYVHVACCTCPRQSLSFAASDVMFMVLQVFYNGFFSHWRRVINPKRLLLLFKKLTLCGIS